MQTRKSPRNTMTKATSVAVTNVCAPCRHLSLKRITLGLVLFVVFGACLHYFRSTYLDSQEPVEQITQTEQINLAESPKAPVIQNIQQNREPVAKELPAPAKPILDPSKPDPISPIKPNPPAPIKKDPVPSPAKAPQIKGKQNLAIKAQSVLQEGKKNALQTTQTFPPKGISAGSTSVRAKSPPPNERPPKPPTNNPSPVSQKTNPTTQLVGQDNKQTKSTGKGPSVLTASSSPPKPAVAKSISASQTNTKPAPSNLLSKTPGSTTPKPAVRSIPNPSGKGNAKPSISPVPNIKPPAISPSKQATKNQVTTRKGPLIITNQATSRWPIGYQMFGYAALQGVAVKNEIRPVFPGDMEIYKMFHTRIRTSLDLNSYGPFRSMGPPGRNCDNRSMNVVLKRKDKSFMMKSHWHSWHYFENVKRNIRKQFKFNEEIDQTAEKILSRKARGVYGNSSYVLVGVHVRRTTTLKPSSWTPVATLPEIEYFKKAMDYFRRSYKMVKFYVTGDNRFWNRRNIQGDDVIANSHPLPEVDLAILSKCDHVIMSVGTFGWWGAWLANGKTIYYLPKNMTAPGSTFCKNYYFPPEWIPME